MLALKFTFEKWRKSFWSYGGKTLSEIMTDYFCQFLILMHFDSIFTFFPRFFLAGKYKKSALPDNINNSQKHGKLPILVRSLNDKKNLFKHLRREYGKR